MKKKKLQLKTETLRSLTDNELANVGGAAGSMLSCGGTCWSCASCIMCGGGGGGPGSGGGGNVLM